uniref:G_PROTEIN_RECEP_F1_2 domain-containing protein n=1 Tax=Parastrongyloides trichosuri TaxID=131310 RepID=A0A0N4ZX94_PARTI
MLGILTNVRKVVTDVISITLFSLTFTTIGFIIERIISLIYYQEYENINLNVPWIGILLIIISWIIGIITRILGTYGYYDLQIAIISALIIQIICMAICYLIMVKSRKQYRLNKSIDKRIKNKMRVGTSTTSIRFQTIENKNVIKLMIAFTVTSAILSVLNVIFLLINIKVIAKHQDLSDLYNLFSNLIPYFTAIIVPLSVIYTERRYHVIWIYYINVLTKCCNRKRNNVHPLEAIPNKRIQEEIKMDNEKQRDIYFSSYEDQWK